MRCLPAAVIPAQAGIQSCRHRNLSGKKFPKFYVLDSRLRGMTGLNKLLYQKLNYPQYTKATPFPPPKQKTNSVSIHVYKKVV